QARLRSLLTTRLGANQRQHLSIAERLKLRGSHRCGFVARAKNCRDDLTDRRPGCGFATGTGGGQERETTGIAIPAINVAGRAFRAPSQSAGWDGRKPRFADYSRI